MKKVMLFTIAVSFLSVGSAFAKDEKKVEVITVTTTTTTTEAREQEARMNEEMAVCLRSNKAINECRKAMKKTKEMGATTEVREQQAKAYDEMAACLRSNKTVEECHEAMRMSCKDMPGEKRCQAMNGKKTGKMNKKM